MSNTTVGTRPLTFEELDPALADVLRPRYERLGYLGGFFAHMGHQPDALAAFEQFTLACRRALPIELAELVALSVATRLSNRYEQHQHERLSVASGLDHDWVAQVERLEPERATLLTPIERACQRYVLASIERLAGHDSPAADLLTTIRDSTDDATAAAVALLTARYIGHATVVAACRLTPPVPSIFSETAEGVPTDV